MDQSGEAVLDTDLLYLKIYNKVDQSCEAILDTDLLYLKI